MYDIDMSYNEIYYKYYIGYSDVYNYSYIS